MTILPWVKLMELGGGDAGDELAEAVLVDGKSVGPARFDGERQGGRHGRVGERGVVKASAPFDGLEIGRGDGERGVVEQRVELF